MVHHRSIARAPVSLRIAVSSVCSAPTGPTQPRSAVSDRYSHAPPASAVRPVTSAGVRLSVLAGVANGEVRRGDPRSVVIRDVTHDSRSAGPGVLLACRPGRDADGHDYAPRGVELGSPALMVERELELAVPQLLVDSVAERLGAVAARVHGDPSRALEVCGVTGTNGKTTTTWLLEHAQAMAGRRTGLIGTIETRVAGERIAGIRTTPEATDLQRLLAAMRASGTETVAMEVSSHGLELGRVNGTHFAVAAFTNLTQDHLDFHHTMDEYYTAKARLFSPGFADAAVINVDDPFGRRLARERTVPVLTVSPSDAVAADVTVHDVAVRPSGSSFTIQVAGRSWPVWLALPGRFNVVNAALVLAMAQVLGLPLESAVRSLADVPTVPGRLEPVAAGQSFAVLVDYAHTPDSLVQVLASARELTSGRLLLVVGCGGDRDQDKRPRMGAAAVQGADDVIFTNDNPRGEDPEAILNAMIRGARAVTGGRWRVRPDRREAIAAALAAAAPGDVVVIAGKGHETGQQIGDRTLPFDDRQVAHELLRQGEYG